MPKYYYHKTNYHERQRHIIWVKRIIFLFVLIILAGVALIAYDIFHQKYKKYQPVSQLTTVVQQPPINVIRTQYYQFQAAPTWVEVANETSNNKFVYRNFKGLDLQQELDIWVNVSQPADHTLIPEYIVPVKVKPDGSFVVSPVSDLCKNALPPTWTKRDPVRLTYKDVTFLCNVDGTEFTAQAGAINGSEVIKMNRPDGSTATYTIVFRDLTISPNFQFFQNILSTFMTR